MQEVIIEVAKKDATIPDPEKEDFTAYDLSNVFTVVANSDISDDMRDQFSEIGGRIVMQPALLRKHVKRVKA